MEKKLMGLMVALVLSTSFVYAEVMTAEATEADETVGASDVAPVAVEVGNKICPISGEVLAEGQAEQVTVNGKIYNVCKMGKEMFEKDPAAMAEKFDAFDMKMAEDAVKMDAPAVPVATY